MSEQIKIFKYKPFKKTVVMLSPDGSKREEKEVIVKDAYIMIKSNGDSIVGNAKLMRSFGFSVEGVKAEYNHDTTNANIVEDGDETETKSNKTETKPTQNTNKIPEGLTKVEPNKQ